MCSALSVVEFQQPAGVKSKNLLGHDFERLPFDRFASSSSGIEYKSVGKITQSFYYAIWLRKTTRFYFEWDWETSIYTNCIHVVNQLLCIYTKHGHTPAPPALQRTQCSASVAGGARELRFSVACFAGRAGAISRFQPIFMNSQGAVPGRTSVCRILFTA